MRSVPPRMQLVGAAFERCRPRRPPGNGLHNLVSIEVMRTLLSYVCVPMGNNCGKFNSLATAPIVKVVLPIDVPAPRRLTPPRPLALWGCRSCADSQGVRIRHGQANDCFGSGAQ